MQVWIKIQLNAPDVPATHFGPFKSENEAKDALADKGWEDNKYSITVPLLGEYTYFACVVMLPGRPPSGYPKKQLMSAT